MMMNTKALKVQIAPAHRDSYIILDEHRPVMAGCKIEGVCPCGSAKAVCSVHCNEAFAMDAVMQVVGIRGYYYLVNHLGETGLFGHDMVLCDHVDILEEGPELTSYNCIDGRLVPACRILVPNENGTTRTCGKIHDT